MFRPIVRIPYPDDRLDESHNRYPPPCPQATMWSTPMPIQLLDPWNLELLDSKGPPPPFSLGLP